MIAGVFTITLLSLAGIPLTAGFVGKVYIVAAAASALLWVWMFTFVVTSAISLFYYLRIIVALYSREERTIAARVPLRREESLSLTWTLGAFTAAVIAIGCYPSAVLRLIQK